MLGGSVIIVIHGVDRLSNLISLNGSLFGGLITLISISITNRYYNEEKIEQENENKIERISKKLNALKFLKKEISINKNIFQPESTSKFLFGKFQTVIWEEFRKEFVEIFINNPEEELYNLQKLYETLMEGDNFVSTGKIEMSGVKELFEPIEISIDKKIANYDKKLKKLTNRN